MKKALAVTLVFILALSVLAGCGGGSGSSGSGGSSSGSSSSGSSNSSGSSSRSSSSTAKPGSTHNPANNPPRKVEPPSKPVDLTDDSNYFVVIDGVKYSLFNRTIKDFLDAGYTMSKYDDPEEKVEPGEKTGGEPGTIHMATDIYKLSYSENSTYFQLQSYNATDKVLPMKDCSLYKIRFRYDDYEKDDDAAISALVYTVGNLAPGCTEDDVISVFGEDYDEWMYDYGELIYSDRTLSRSWEFYRDEPGGVVRQIVINTDFGY